MPNTVTFDELCLSVSEDLSSALEAGNLSRKPQRVGLLEALISPQNTNGVQIDDQLARDGKTNKVLVRHLVPDAEADSTDTITSLCDEDGTAHAYVWSEVTADMAVQSEVKLLTADQVRTLCETGSEFRQELISLSLDSLRRNINAQLIPVFEAGCGGILDGDGETGTEYNVIYTDSAGRRSALPQGLIDMEIDLDDVGVNDRPIIVGGGNMYLYTKEQGIACCNDLGVDASQMEMQMFRDNQISKILTGPSYDNPFFAFAPQAAVFCPTPKNVGQFRMIADTFVRDTIIDPLTGLEVDFDLFYDYCGGNGRGEWKFKTSLNFGLYQLPLTLFKSTDPRYKVNFNFSFRATAISE
jgi:hypothetical protein